jgi:hypothetical protein
MTACPESVPVCGKKKHERSKTMRNFYDYSLYTGETKAALHLHNMGDESNTWYFFPFSHPDFAHAWEQLLSEAFSLHDDREQRFSLTLADGSQYHVPQDQANAILDALADALEQNMNQVQKAEKQPCQMMFPPKRNAGQPGTGAWGWDDLQRMRHQRFIPAMGGVVCVCCGIADSFSHKTCGNCGAPYLKDGLQAQKVPLNALHSPDDIKKHIRLEASPQQPNPENKQNAPASSAWECACGAEGQTGQHCTECGMEKEEMLRLNRQISVQKNAEGNRIMSDIRFVTSGQMAVYLPNGTSRSAEIIQLQCYKENGAVIIAQDKPLTLKADSSVLAETIAAIEALLSENPDCPCEQRPFFNEICFQDGTYRYAPRQSLYDLLSMLYQNARIPELQNTAAALRPAGVVAANIPPKRTIKRIKLKWRDIFYLIDAQSGGNMRMDMVYPDSSIGRYQFPEKHPAFAEAEKQIFALSPFNEECKAVIQFSDGGSVSTDPEVLFDILDKLQMQLEKDRENIQYSS